MPAFNDYFSGPGGDVPAGLPSSKVGIAETFPRQLVSVEATQVTNTWNASAIYLPAGLVINCITLFAGTTAISAATHQWFGLWNSSLALLAGSADDTSTAWSANTAKRLALTAAFRTTYSGRYYVGLGTTATGPSLLGAVSNGATRTLTPAVAVNDTTTALTALAATLTNTTTVAIVPAPYAVLD